MIYFDYASTTPMRPEILKNYTYVLEKYFANTDSLHTLGIQVAELMEKSREQIASCLKVKSEEIFFTSGASEANNMAIKGCAFAYQNRGRHLITSCVEHSSVLHTFEQLEEIFGFEVTYLPVNKEGKVEVETLRKALRPDTVLVSIMALNNEVGAINPIHELAECVHANSRALFHSDCTQMLGKYPLDFLKEIDYASFSAHKIFGCKGSGFLYKRNHVKLVPLINGGQQEDGLRGGTSNAPANIVLAKTLRLALDEMAMHYEKVQKLNQRMRTALAQMDEVEINSPDDASVYVLNFSFTCITSEIMLNALDNRGFCVSAQSTCSSKTNRPSHVIINMGYSEARAGRAIRCSFSHYNTEEEVDKFIQTIKEILNDYRVKL